MKTIHKEIRRFMSLNKAVSIVVPTLNEEDNIDLLVERIAASFKDSGVDYEIIFVDDHSVDNTVDNVEKLLGKYPIKLFKKSGERGKAYSLLEGFDNARYDVICMIDADLQYPPEAILEMFKLIDSNNADMVITERNDHQTSKLRQLSSKTFNFLFTKLLFGFNYDSQSGLKVFKKKVINSVSLTPTPWSFDLEFIVRALENNFIILNYSIPFHQRNAGVAKVKLFEVTYELAKASIKLRFNSSPKVVKQSYNRSLQFSKKVAGSLTLGVAALSFLAATLTLSPRAGYAVEVNLDPSNPRQNVSDPLTVNIQPSTMPVINSVPMPVSFLPQPINSQNVVKTMPRATPAPVTPAPVSGNGPAGGAPQTNSPAEQASVINLQGPGAQSSEATYPNYKTPSDQYKAPPQSRASTAVYGTLGALVAALLGAMFFTSQTGRGFANTARAKISGVVNHRNA